MEDQTHEQASSRQKIPNVLIDSALALMQQQIIQEGYSQLSLPPSETQFSEKTLGITWHGTLLLTNGILSGLQSLHRVNEATLSLNDHMVNGIGQWTEIMFTVDLGLTSPTTKHDFYLTFMNKDMSGQVTGMISSVTFTIILGLNGLTKRMRLIELYFEDLGQVEIRIEGLGTILNFLASKISKIHANRTKWELATIIKVKLKELLSNVVDNMEWTLPECQNLLIAEMKSIFAVGQPWRQ